MALLWISFIRDLASKSIRTLRHKINSLRLLVLRGYIITLGLPKISPFIFFFFFKICVTFTPTHLARELCTGLAEKSYLIDHY